MPNRNSEVCPTFFTCVCFFLNNFVSKKIKGSTLFWNLIGFLLYPLKTPGNLWFSDVFKGYNRRLIRFTKTLVAFEELWV